MPEAQDTQIHLPCQHFRCDSFRFDKQKRRLGEGADAMADASQHGAEDHRHTRGHNPEHPQADYGRGPCQEMAPDQRPTCLAVDGFAVHKGHRYAACVMDLGNGDVLWVGKGARRRISPSSLRSPAWSGSVESKRWPWTGTPHARSGSSGTCRGLRCGIYHIRRKENPAHARKSSGDGVNLSLSFPQVR